MRQSIRQCWNVDVNAANVPAVEVRVQMRPDGTVEEATVVDTARFASDPAFNAAARRALRAVAKPHLPTVSFAAKRLSELPKHPVCL